MKEVYVGIISHDIYIYISHDLNTNTQTHIYYIVI